MTACQLVNTVIPARSPMPVYQGIKVIADDRMTLLATDLDVGIRHQLEGVRIEEPGVAVWPAARIIAILRESSCESVRIDSDARQTHVAANGSDYELPAEDPATFADFCEAEEDRPHWAVAAGGLSRMLARTAFAAAKDEGKYAMRGILTQLEGNLLTLAATDGKRLAVGSMPAVSHDAATVSGIISPKAVQLIGKAMTEPGEPVSIDLRTNDLVVSVGKSLIYSRLVEGTYPPYRTVIPKKHNSRITLDRESFLSAVRQAAVMTDEESKRINFAFQPGKVELSAQGSTTGKSKVVHRLEGYDGPAISISFDPAYLTEFLRAVGEESVALELVDGQKSAVFRCGGDYLYLVVPLV